MTNLGYAAMARRATSWPTTQLCPACDWPRFEFIDYSVNDFYGPQKVEEYRCLNCGDHFDEPKHRNDLAEALAILTPEAQSQLKLLPEERHLQAAIDAAAEFAERLALIEAEVIGCTDPARLRQMLVDGFRQARKDQGMETRGRIAA